jgi:flavin-binding protein dodecin
MADHQGRVTGTSSESFAQAAEEAFAQIDSEGDVPVEAVVTEAWMSKGGITPPQYNVELQQVDAGSSPSVRSYG